MVMRSPGFMVDTSTVREFASLYEDAAGDLNAAFDTSGRNAAPPRARRAIDQIAF